MDEESALSVRHAPPTVADLAARLWAERPDAPVFVVGLTGGVACGKSTLARALTEALAALAPKPRVERVGADGFLFPNAVLSARGVLDRKGSPETYDQAAMARALIQVRLPNLETHIEPLRQRADLIVTKGADHGIPSIAAGVGESRR